MQKITPFLWFNTNAEEAVAFYMSVFKDAKLLKTTRYTEAGPGPAGSLMTAVFELQGQQFIALNGGPAFQFTEAISFVVNCEGQDEIDELWEKLSEGGEKDRCGWVKDRFGLWWQVVPATLGELMSGSDAERTKRVMQAMLKMSKLDLRLLEEAYNQAGETV